MTIQAPELPTAGSALLRGGQSGDPGSLARADHLKLSLFDMCIGMEHSLGMGNLYSSPLRSPSPLGKCQERLRETARMTRSLRTPKEEGSMCKCLETMQDPGPQMPCGVIYYKNILFLRTKITFKELGMEDLGIYSCDVTDTDGIAASYLIDEEGKFKASSFTSPSCFEFSMMFYHRVTFVLVIQGLIVLFFSLQSWNVYLLSAKSTSSQVSVHNTFTV